MATKKVVAGMRDLWTAAKSDLTTNTKELKQDFKGMLEVARSAKKGPRETKPLSLLELSVNHDAGGELLTHFKEEWSGIHKRTMEASETVVKLDSELQSIQKSLSQSHSIISNCREEFSHLPDAVKSVETVKEKVMELGKLLQQVEDSITEYSRVTAQLEMERKQHSLRIQFERHQELAEQEIRRLEGVLAAEKKAADERQRGIETRKIQERQQAFQDIFNKQMADYRKKGEIERPIGAESRERASSQLEDVVIEDEDGTASLNEFLSDVVIEDEGVAEESRDKGGESRDQDDSCDEPLETQHRDER